MSLGQKLAPHLPFLRRYSRALNGEQARGDAYVKTTLEAIIAAPEEFDTASDIKISLYRTFHAIWSSTREDHDDALDMTSDDVREQITQSRLASLASLPRQALLLTVVEGFSHQDAAFIIDSDVDTVGQLVEEAMHDIESQISTNVLIIEDEPIIAMDIETIVEDMGHKVAGIAATRDEAVELAGKTSPGLILADIQLADNSSGIDAVADILNDQNIPVIFITAFPERLLTGERLEPVFLITKPFQRDTVRAAISQALFFHQ